MKKIESSAYKIYDTETTVQLLSRLKSDCDYVLKFGGERNLWGKTVDDHIEAMRFYLNSLKDKPSWLTKADIDEYEKKLKAKFSKSVEEVSEVARHLVKLEVFFDGQNSYSFNYEGKVKVFRGDENALTKFLQSFKAKDNKTQPRSLRGERYADIAKGIIDGSDRIIYAWSNDLANAFNKREQVKSMNENVDEVILDSVTFKSSGLYNKVAAVYNKSWAEWLSIMADDKDCHKAGFSLISDADFITLNITKLGQYKNWILFFSDKSGSKEGDFIKVVPNGLFSKQFAASKNITFIGVENNELVIKSNNTYLCMLEDCVSQFSRIEESAYDSVFLFYDSEAQSLFTYYLKAAKVKFDVVMNKVSVDRKQIDDIPEIIDLLDKYPDEIVSYSTKEYADLMKKGLLESVSFTRDGVYIDNSDGALFEHLFDELEGDPRWKVDKGHRRCIRNDGHYFCIKGNMLEVGNRTSVFITIPWTKEIRFMLLPDADIIVEFEINAAGPGRFRI